MKSTSISMPAGIPSTTPPMAGPWLSPKVVRAKRFPNVLRIIVMWDDVCEFMGTRAYCFLESISFRSCNAYKVGSL